MSCMNGPASFAAPSFVEGEIVRYRLLGRYQLLCEASARAIICVKAKNPKQIDVLREWFLLAPA